MKYVIIAVFVIGLLAVPFLTNPGFPKIKAEIEAHILAQIDADRAKLDADPTRSKDGTCTGLTREACAEKLARNINVGFEYYGIYSRTTLPLRGKQIMTCIAALTRVFCTDIKDRERPT